MSERWNKHNKDLTLINIFCIEISIVHQCLIEIIKESKNKNNLFSKITKTNHHYKQHRNLRCVNNASSENHQRIIGERKFIKEICMKIINVSETSKISETSNKKTSYHQQQRFKNIKASLKFLQRLKNKNSISSSKTSFIQRLEIKKKRKWSFLFAFNSSLFHKGSVKEASTKHHWSINETSMSLRRKHNKIKTFPVFKS